MLKIFKNRPSPLPRLPARRIGGLWQPGLVSVVLPVYNGAAYLEEAIASVLAQTMPRWELLVVDDGSTDESAALAERWARKDPRVRVFSGPNQKLPRALNRGFREAKGEFYTWLSADNRMLPRFLEVMTGEMAARPDTDMLYGNMYLIGPEGQRLTHHGWFELPPGSSRVMLPATAALLNTVPNNTIGAAFLYRAGVDAVLGGYSPRRYLLEDYDYFMRVNSLFRLRHSKEREPLYEYRMHPGSLTARDRELGITASRPSLMAFDALRRDFYHKSLWIRLEPETLWLRPNLRRAGLRPILPEDPAEPPPGQSLRLVSALPVSEPPEPWYLLRTEPLRLEGRDWPGPVCFATAQDLADFLRLRGACDLLRQKGG